MSGGRICEAPLVPPIASNRVAAAAPPDAVSQLPEVQADGKGTQMDFHICVGHHSGHSSVLWNLPACAVHYLDLAHQCKPLEVANFC